MTGCLADLEASGEFSLLGDFGFDLIRALCLETVLGPGVEVECLGGEGFVVTLLGRTDVVWQRGVGPLVLLEVDLKALAKGGLAHEEDDFFYHGAALAVFDAVDQALGSVRGRKSA